MNEIVSKNEKNLIAGQNYSESEYKNRENVNENEVDSVVEELQCVNEIDSVLDVDYLKPEDIFPRVSFPWAVLPPEIVGSLKQLARSCAASPLSLPGVAICTIASVVGRKYFVSPKASWAEPLIFWFADIRKSGAGKTPGMEKLIDCVKKLQSKEDLRARVEEDLYAHLDADEKQGVSSPEQLRGYWTTDFTVEGIHRALSGHPTGGLLVPMPELSSFVNSQGAYKNGKGSDREACLALHDGRESRVIRKSGPISIAASAVQVCGGIQPEVFVGQFGTKSGIYLNDGTIYRFLFSYETSSYFDLTAESWSEENRARWEETVMLAADWAESHEAMIATLSAEAQERFISWRNLIYSHVEKLPAVFQGFVPKGCGYALRLAGALHLLDCFSNGLQPKQDLGLQEIERGIVLMEFYFAQALDAIKLLMSPKDSVPVDVADDESYLLAEALDRLRNEVDKEKLSVGYIAEKYNSLVQRVDHITAKKAGILLRKYSLPPAPGKYDVNGAKRVSCLVWSKNVEAFISKTFASRDRSKALNVRLDAARYADRLLTEGNNETWADFETMRFQCPPVKSVMDKEDRDIEMLETCCGRFDGIDISLLVPGVASRQNLDSSGVVII